MEKYSTYLLKDFSNTHFRVMEQIFILEVHFYTWNFTSNEQIWGDFNMIDAWIDDKYILGGLIIQFK